MKTIKELSHWELITEMHKVDIALREYKKGFWWEYSDQMVPFMKNQLCAFKDEISYRHLHKDEVATKVQDFDVFHYSLKTNAEILDVGYEAEKQKFKQGLEGKEEIALTSKPGRKSKKK